MQRYRVALIGAGMIANEAHIPAYERLANDFELVAVSDRSEEAAKKTAQRFGIAGCYTDTQKMLDEIAPDVVSITTPNTTHEGFVLAALQAGAHVLCEKPLSLSYQKALQLFETARANGRNLITCQTQRFHPEYQSAKRLLAEGYIGSPYYAEFSCTRRRGIPQWGTFHIRELSGGGAFCDIGVHLLDSLLWMLDGPQVEAVAGSAWNKLSHLPCDPKQSGASTVHTARPYRPEEFDVEDLAVGSIRLAGGLRIQCKAAWVLHQPPSEAVIIAGTEGGLRLPGLTMYHDVADRLADTRLEVPPLEMEGLSFPNHLALLAHARDVLRGRAELLIRPEETLNVIAALELFYRAAELGREAELSELA